MKKIYLSIFTIALATVANAQMNITFRVDMNAAQLGADAACTAIPFDPSTDVVEAMGADYNNWSATETVNCGSPFTPNATDFIAIGGGIYERTQAITPANASDSPFKYRINHSWGNDELRGVGDGNRHLNLSTFPTGASILVTCIFNDTNMVITDITNVKSIENTVAAFVASPNPSANGMTKLTYSLQGNEDVLVKVYNVVGAEVATLVNASQSAGVHQINWNTSTIEKGIYTVIARTATGSKAVRVAVQ